MVPIVLELAGFERHETDQCRLFGGRLHSVPDEGVDNVRNGLLRRGAFFGKLGAFAGLRIGSDLEELFGCQRRCRLAVPDQQGRRHGRHSGQQCEGRKQEREMHVGLNYLSK